MGVNEVMECRDEALFIQRITELPSSVRIRSVWLQEKQLQEKQRSLPTT